MPLEELYRSLANITITGANSADSYCEAERVKISSSIDSQVNDIHIYSTADSRQFIVEHSINDELFTEQLTVIANTLKSKIGCWPSVGLTACVMTAMISKSVFINNLRLLPSIAKASNLLTEQHLASMEYNWLGERRMALGIALTHQQLQWPELFLSPVINTDERSQLNPFLVLLGSRLNIEALNKPSYPVLDLATQPIQQTEHYRKQLAILNQLVKMDSQHWLAFAEQQQLILCESLFYNSNPQHRPCYWFLVDNQATQYLDTIRHRLAYCQQVLAFRTMTKST